MASPACPLAVFPQPGSPCHHSVLACSALCPPLLDSALSPPPPPPSALQVRGLRRVRQRAGSHDHALAAGLGARAGGRAVRRHEPSEPVMSRCLSADPGSSALFLAKLRPCSRPCCLVHDFTALTVLTPPNMHFSCPPRPPGLPAVQGCGRQGQGCRHAVQGHLLLPGGAPRPAQRPAQGGGGHAAGPGRGDLAAGKPTPRRHHAGLAA